MLIQPYLENAIIHGLRKSTKPGHLILEIVETKNLICCTIQDNGIGRTKASTIKGQHHRSVAMSNIEARLELLKMEFGGDEFSVSVTDLWNGEEPAGTVVKLSLPNDLH